MRVAILSPHRDDAAFSCGLTMLALLQAGAAITVINVFTHSDYAVDLRTIDLGLPLVDAVSQARRLEDEHFVADVISCAAREPGSVGLQDLDWLDAPLRLTVRTEQVLESPLTDAEVEREAADLASQLTSLQTFDVVFAPLALGHHIDHRVARDAAKLCVAADRLCRYEDLPYAARLGSGERNAQASLAMSSKRTADCKRYGLHLQHGPHLKKRFAMHYPSQIAEEVADEMAAYAGQGSTGDAGAEHWWAMPAVAVAISALLQGGSMPCTLVEEQQ